MAALSRVSVPELMVNWTPDEPVPSVNECCVTLLVEVRLDVSKMFAAP